MTLRCKFEVHQRTTITFLSQPIKNIKTIECCGELHAYDPLAMRGFCNILRHSPYSFDWTTMLDISHLKMGDLHFHYLLAGIKLMPMLQAFIARSNKLTDTSMVLFCQKWPMTLQFLDLGNNLLTDTGFILLIDFLSKMARDHEFTPHSPNINTLILRGNKFKDCLDHPAVIEFFQSNTFLQRVDLRECELCYNGLECFIGHIARNTVLRTFLVKPAIIQSVLDTLYICKKMSPFFQENTSLAHVSMPKPLSLNPATLSNYLFSTSRTSFDYMFNPNLSLPPHFHNILRREAIKFFHPNQFEPYLFTGHPFYTMLMTVLLCNDALPRRLPTHLLLNILSFLRPATYPFVL